MMFVPNQLLGAPLGSTVTLECVTEAQPRPITYWLRTDAANGNGVMLLASKNLKPITHYNGYQTQMSLEIQRLELQDIGNYKCVSKNSLGEAEGSIRIYGTLHFSGVKVIIQSGFTEMFLFIEVVMTQPPTKHAETRATSAEGKQFGASFSFSGQISDAVSMEKMIERLLSVACVIESHLASRFLSTCLRQRADLITIQLMSDR
jgi:hypothetical protein